MNTVECDKVPTPKMTRKRAGKKRLDFPKNALIFRLEEHLGYSKE